MCSACADSSGYVRPDHRDLPDLRRGATRLPRPRRELGPRRARRRVWQPAQRPLDVKRLPFAAPRGDLRHRRRGGRAARDAMPMIGRSASRPPCVPRAASGPVPLLP